VISLLDLSVEKTSGCNDLWSTIDWSPGWGLCPEGLRGLKHRWEPLFAGLKSHQRAHRDPKISLGEVEAPMPQG